VHQLRGTKSRYQYTVATSQPSLQQHIPLKPVDSVISYSTGPRTTTTPPSLLSNSDLARKNQGVQARERVLEAIAPMRRGRPANSTESRDSSSRPSSPQKSSTVPKPGLDLSNPWMADENKAWQTATSGSNVNGRVGSLDWNVGGAQQQAAQGPKEPTGFGDDFAEKLWRSSDPKTVLPPPPKVSPILSPSSVNQLRSQAAPIRHVAHTGNDIVRRDREKDAFDGLGLSVSSEKPAPTLGEARKLRTGLATTSTNMVTPQSYNRNDEKQSANSIRPSASPRLPYLTPQPPQQPSSSPAPSIASNSSSSWRGASFPSSGSNPPTASRPDGLPIENRFPSLEELDAQFSPNLMYPAAARSADSRYATHHLVVRSNDKSPQLPPRPAERKTVTVNTERLELPTLPSYGRDGVRSEQVTGVAMRESEGGRRKDSDIMDRKPKEKEPEIKTEDLQPRSEMLRPVLQRKHRSSVSIKQTFDPNSPAESSKATKVPTSPSNFTHASRRIPAPALPGDWLTGDDDEQQNYTVQTAEQKTVAVPVLRDSPSKRASFIERSDLNIQNPAVAQHDTTPAPVAPEPDVPQVSPTVTRFTKTFPLIDTSYPQEVTSHQSRSPVATPALKEKEPESSSSADEGPEEPNRLISAAGNTARSNRTRRKGRQSSVHDLVDLWGGGVNTKEKAQVKVSPQSTLPSDYRPAKTRPSTLLSPPTQLLINPRSSPSPERLSSSRPSPTATRQPSRNDEPVRQAISGDAATPSGSRRPQSMFIFPSKSTDYASSPEEPRPRSNVRRTSISDRVQRFEAIGGRGSAPRPPSPVSHKLPNIKTTQLTESPRVDSSENHGPGDPVKNRTTSTLPPRQSSAIPRSPVKCRNTHPVEKPESKQEHEKPTRRSPFKSESLALASTGRKEVFLEENRQGSTEQGRSPSPDRPYQGVGKLIDQWQRKTAEGNAKRPTIGNKAPASIPKRAGTVHVGTDGS
jgi:AP2-associated kinase